MSDDTTPRPEPDDTNAERAAVGGELDATIVEIRERGPDIAFRLLLVVLFLRLVWPMALPLILGGFATIVLLPPNQRLARRLGRGRALAPWLITVGSALAFLVPVVWIGARVVRAANSFVASLVATGDGSSRERLITVISDLLGESASRQEITGYLADGTRKLAATIGTALADLATSLPDAVTSGFLFAITLYFGLRDGPRLLVWARRVSPVSRSRTGQLFVAVERAAHGTLVGMIVVAVVQGGLASIAFLALGIPHALFWGFIAGVCSTFPIVGTTPVTFGASVFLYLHGRPLAALGMIAAAVFIGASDNIIRPWVQSQHDDMHPLLALVAIFGGLAVFGPAGLLLGPVIASMAVWAVESSPAVAAKATADE